MPLWAAARPPLLSPPSLPCRRRQYVTTGERALLQRTKQLVESLAREVQQQRRRTQESHFGGEDDIALHDKHFASEVGRAGWAGLGGAAGRAGQCLAGQCCRALGRAGRWVMRVP
jgi:hypothetical protein